MSIPSVTKPTATLEAKTKVFVGGLKGCINEEELLAFFSSKGSVYSLELKYKKKSKKVCLGYGVLEMDSQSAKTLINRQFLSFQDRNLRCSPYLKGKELTEYLSDLNARRLLLSGLGEDFSESVLHDYFSEFGALENAYIIERYGKEMEKGKGFIVFEKAESALKALQQGSIQTIRDHEVRVEVFRQEKRVKKERKDSSNTKSKQDKASQNKDSHDESNKPSRSTEEHKLNTPDSQLPNPEVSRARIKHLPVLERIKPCSSEYWELGKPSYVHSDSNLRLNKGKGSINRSNRSSEERFTLPLIKNPRTTWDPFFGLRLPKSSGNRLFGGFEM